MHGDDSDVENVVEVGPRFRETSPTSNKGGQGRVRTSHVYRDVGQQQERQRAERKRTLGGHDVRPTVVHDPYPDPQEHAYPQPYHQQPYHQQSYHQQPYHQQSYHQQPYHSQAPPYGYDYPYGSYGPHGSSHGAAIPFPQYPPYQPHQLPSQLSREEQKQLVKAKLAKLAHEETNEGWDGYEEYRPEDSDDEYANDYRVRQVKERRAPSKPRTKTRKSKKVQDQLIFVNDEKVLLPAGWEVEYAPVGPVGVLPPGVTMPTTPMFISPEGIVCWSADMMEGCESTRKRDVLNLERSLTSLKMDMERLAKEPLLDVTSDRAIGRDSVMRYRVSFCQWLNKMGALRKRIETSAVRKEVAGAVDLTEKAADTIAEGEATGRKKEEPPTTEARHSLSEQKTAEQKAAEQKAAEPGNEKETA